MRRCAESWRDGRFVLEQGTNAYAVPPDSQWRGYRPPLEAPGPSRIGTSLRFMCASLTMRSLPHRSQVIRMNHDGNARNGSSRASQVRSSMVSHQVGFYRRTIEGYQAGDEEEDDAECQQILRGEIGKLR